jgi:hypothetical protein
MNLCKYRDSLGKPNEGFHEKRIEYLNIALYDTLGTFGISLILSLIIYCFRRSNFFKILIWTTLILFLSAIIIHRIFCVNTTINKLIFGEIK